MKELMHKPMDEEWFSIVPANINSFTFTEKRKDVLQERTRLLIVDALEIVKKNSKFYGRPFKTLRPTKTWLSATEIYLIERSHRCGEYLGTWIEQSLEWAQRIQNGESWEELCNKKEYLRWYRMIMWRDGDVRLIGGSTENNDYNPTTTIIGADDETMREKLKKFTIPLVVRY